MFTAVIQTSCGYAVLYFASGRSLVQWLRLNADWIDEVTHVEAVA